MRIGNASRRAPRPLPTAEPGPATGWQQVPAQHSTGCSLHGEAPTRAHRGPFRSLTPVCRRRALRFSAIERWRSLMRSEPSGSLPRSLFQLTVNLARRMPAVDERPDVEPDAVVEVGLPADRLLGERLPADVDVVGVARPRGSARACAWSSTRRPEAGVGAGLAGPDAGLAGARSSRRGGCRSASRASRGRAGGSGAGR